MTGRRGHGAPPDDDDDDAAAEGAADDDELVEDDDVVDRPPGGGLEERRLPVDAAAAGRIDTFVAARIPELTRAQVKRLIDDGDVRVGGAPVAKAGHKLRAGDEVVVVLRPPAPIDVEPEDIPLAVLFEDAHLIAIDKPPGLVVHPAPGHASGTLVNALLHHCRGELAGIGGAIRPGIVHRLDKDTSGVMVVAKDEPTHLALAAAFKRKSEAGAAGEAPEPDGVVREYLAVVAPAPPGDEGTIRTLHGRHPTHRKKFSSRVASGKPAVTHWRVVERFAADAISGRDSGGAALIRCRLATGRTHQIRVHMADAGWPLLGDALYGRRGRTPRLAELGAALGRQALHAERLALTHPATGERLDLRAPLPDDLARLITALRA